MGNRLSIFVTHVEFQNAGCQVFVHVGDLGSQADTVIERTDEHVASGAAEIPSSCSVGDLCLALFHEDNGWYRAKVLSVSGQSVTVFFIDYGNTETVNLDKLRTASDYVLAIPALSTKCIVGDCTPFNDQSWTEEEIKKIEALLHSQEFVAEVTSVEPSASLQTCTVKLFKNDEPDVPVFLRKSSSSSDLSVKVESLQVGKEYEVFVSFVESPQKFWVQLKDKETDLNSLMSEISACFAEDLPSTGDISNPTAEQICISCFSEDGSFYRAKVQSIQGDSCKVIFVDYGNSEDKSTSELFTLPQVLSTLPLQAIQCSYKSNSNTTQIEERLCKLESDGLPCFIRTVSKSGSSYVVQIDSIEKVINQSQTPAVVKTKQDVKLWTSIPSVVMQVGGVYDVCLSHIEHPGRFFVQLIGNASKIDDVMQSIDEIAHNCDGLVVSNPGTLCLAKFSDDAWYRAEVLSVEDGKLTLGAVDFGFIESFQSKQLLRKIDQKFKELPAQSVVCTLHSDRLNKQDWSQKDIDKFSALADKSALVCRVASKKQMLFQVDLFDTTNNQERHINNELISAGASVTPIAQPVEAKVSTISEKPQAIIPSPEAKIGSQITLCITAIKSTSVFGQVTHTPVDKVAKLQTDLNTHYDKQAAKTIDNIDRGCVCCTQYSDGGWYRAIVTSDQGSQVEVSFADFGDSLMKPKSDLKVLDSSFCELPQQCILVSIDNLPSVPTSKLESVLVNNRITVKLKNKEGTCIGLDKQNF